MYIQLGTPIKLDTLDINPLELSKLKDKFEILIIDDNTPAIVESLRRSGFRIRDFKDIETIETVEPYPIIACDIEGIGKNFRPGSKNGGIHVLREIRKHYPDKYLIQYSTKSQDIDESLTQADVIFPKDTTIDGWQDKIEESLRELGNPKKRWLKVRRRLSDEGLDGHDIFMLEQSYIKSLTSKKYEIGSDSTTNSLSPAIKKIIKNFAATTLVMGIKEMLLP